MRKSGRIVLALAAASSLVLAACGGDDDTTDTKAPTTEAPGSTAAPTTDGGSTGAGKVGVILPDSKSSARWETADRKYLSEAFDAAGVAYDIQNAEGDAANMATIADQMITGGVTVLMIVNLDSESGAAIQAKAADAGVKSIDYDRLTLGGAADVYISFDNEQVGKLQGEGLMKCIEAKGVPSRRPSPC